MSTIALALSDGVPMFELASPCTIFGTGRPPEAQDWYDFRVCGPRNARVDRWFQTTTPFGYDGLVDADTVIVPACHDNDLHPPAELVQAVRAAFDNGARLVSICTGAFVLAEAGILDGRRAATHWMHARTLANRRPAVTVDAGVLYIDDGRVLTSAGKAAGTDLCLHLVRTDHGSTVANAIARRLVTAPHREGGQAQYIDEPPFPRSNDTLAPAMEWALTHLDEPISVDQLAARAHLGVRTLNRHFHARVGTNPLSWLQHQRTRRAQELLERSPDSIELVAHRSGFASASALRRQFHKVLGTTPDAYRRTFRGPSDSC